VVFDGAAGALGPRQLGAVYGAFGAGESNEDEPMAMEAT
jgi:hypothetical protein